MTRSSKQAEMAAQSYMNDSNQECLSINSPGLGHRRLLLFHVSACLQQTLARLVPNIRATSCKQTCFPASRRSPGAQQWTHPACI